MAIDQQALSTLRALAGQANAMSASGWASAAPVYDWTAPDGSTWHIAYQQSGSIEQGGTTYQPTAFFRDVVPGHHLTGDRQEIYTVDGAYQGTAAIPKDNAFRDFLLMSAALLGAGVLTAAGAGAGAAAGASASASSSATAGQVLSKAALDGTTAFGANSVAGAVDISGLAAAAPGAASANAVSQIAANYGYAGTSSVISSMATPTQGAASAGATSAGGLPSLPPGASTLASRLLGGSSAPGGQVRPATAGTVQQQPAPLFAGATATQPVVWIALAAAVFALVLTVKG